MPSSDVNGDDFASQIRDRIRDWLMEENWQVGQENPPAVKWALSARDAFGRPIVIGQSEDKRDQIVVAASLKISPEHQVRYRALAENKRHALIFDLRNALIQLDVGYAGVGEPFEIIQFSKASYFDGLTKDLFLQRVGKVRNASILARGMIAKALSEPPPEALDEDEKLGFRTP